LADVLLLATAAGVQRYLGAFLAAALLVFYANMTHLRAQEWSSQLRFSMTEAIKRPQSPRATYDYARTMVILTDYRPDSPFTAKAVAALEQAQRVPNSGVLPDQAALMYAARAQRPLQAAWWQDMRDKLTHRPIGPQELASLAALTKCAVDKNCPFPVEEMLGLYRAALAKGEIAEVLNIYGDYALNVLSDSGLALRLWQRACALRPSEPQYRINEIKLLIVLGRYDEARAQIADLRRIGRLGQTEASAQSLEAELGKATRNDARRTGGDQASPGPNATALPAPPRS
jgi:hypothetical protein